MINLTIDPYFYQKLLTYSHIWIGFSGGLDSVVLLHILSSIETLKSRLHVIHVHHGISLHADIWASFCESLCHQANIPFTLEKVKLSSSQNLEANARALRYQAFEKHISINSVLCLAHHLDDDIETFFLQALRGTGVKGLAGIDALRYHHHFEIIRPLLTYPRSEILAYAKHHDLSWIEDDSNTDTQLFRNYLRQDILPRIEKKWPNYRKSLHHTMNACKQWVTRLDPQQAFSSQLDLKDYSKMNDFDWQQLLRAWIKANTKYYPSQKILQQILQQMIYPIRCDNEAIIHLGPYRLIAYRQVLEIFLHTEIPEDVLWHDYPNPMTISPYGEINLSQELVAKLQVKSNDQVFIRFRRGGEKIKCDKGHLCLKKQFQARGIPPYKRARIPLLYVNEELYHVFF